MNFTRYLKPSIKADPRDKMVFIGGPRQVGKTTLANTFIKSDQQYLTWDDLNDRGKIKTHQIDPQLKTVVLFDECLKPRKRVARDREKSINVV